MEIQELAYIKGAGIYSELHFKNGKKEIHNKNLDKLAQILPPNFDRIHKSYIANMDLVEAFTLQARSRSLLSIAIGIEYGLE